MGNLIENKSFDFAVRIVKLCRYLNSKGVERALSTQLLRAGTSIGANVSEAEEAQSRADFLSKINVALKETAETKYWIKLLSSTKSLTQKEASSILEDCTELEKILTSIVRTTRES